MTTPIYLFLFILVFYFLAFILRSWLLWKNTGVNPVTFDAIDDAHGFNGKLFKIIAVFELLIIIVYAFGGDWAKYLLPFWYLENEYLQIIGWVLLHASLVWVLIAQLQMSNSWRIGIDRKNKTALVTKGLFSISRNPVFFGILVADLGFFLVVPNAFTMLVAASSAIVIHTQVRLEEAFLEEEHGEIYTHYYKKVRRWI